MNVASLDLCKELYAVSGWDSELQDLPDHPDCDPKGPIAPAYDLGYLLRKLPYRTKYKDLVLEKVYEDDWRIAYWHDDLPHRGVVEEEVQFACNADTPEDAAASLAISLFKAGILMKGENSNV